jgi:PPP family 3-phenylpropionic acid transporter
MPFSNTPYWRLSGFYFFYFASLGVLVPYWSIYLEWLNFSAGEIGELTAILLATRIFAPYIWAWIADHKGHRMQIVRYTSLGATLTFSAIFIQQSYGWIGTLLLGFSFFWNASLPQFEVTTLQHLGKHSHYYSKIRVWGSIGFIVTVILVGWLIEQVNASVVPIAMVLSLLGIWLVSLTVPESASRHLSLENVSLLSILKRKEVIAFLVICFLVQISFGPYYTFYSIYLEQHKYDHSHIGLLWSLGVIAEVIVFLFVHKWLPILGIKFVLLASVLIGALRWVLIALFPDSLPIIFCAQLLHAANFGTYHAAAIAWIHQHFTGKLQGRGQALYSSISFGAGGAIGSLFSGYMWLSPGPTFIFLTAAALSALAFIIGLIWLQNNENRMQ